MEELSTTPWRSLILGHERAFYQAMEEPSNRSSPRECFSETVIDEEDKEVLQPCRNTSLDWTPLRAMITLAKNRQNQSESRSQRQIQNRKSSFLLAAGP